MFTGLIQHLGTVASIEHDGGGCMLAVADASPILGDCRRLHRGERRMPHRDGVRRTGARRVVHGMARERDARADGSRRAEVFAVVGYVAIDGASLTLTTVNDMQRTFGVMLIKHTQEKITLSKKPLGAKVNIEVDMLGKFVEKSVQAALSGGGTSNLRAMVEKVVEDVLVEKGVV
ncbi:Lumazine-binding protein [Sparassis crispa]|uniref:Lumazine-binding protein n=1 Tax=Sparassis crispa TaxID=139825 RepID=A0A401GSU7_9APHY|nr:Lumazine-binding protein [Sparassis crispa]GBE84814.1 Lumazine-binding protein [Sparassis crispa]